MVGFLNGTEVRFHKLLPWLVSFGSAWFVPFGLCLVGSPSLQMILFGSVWLVSFGCVRLVPFGLCLVGSPWLRLPSFGSVGWVPFGLCLVGSPWLRVVSFGSVWLVSFGSVRLVPLGCSSFHWIVTPPPDFEWACRRCVGGRNGSRSRGSSSARRARRRRCNHAPNRHPRLGACFTSSCRSGPATACGAGVTWGWWRRRQGPKPAQVHFGRCGRAVGGGHSQMDLNATVVFDPR
jgi:hypothetical protein